MVKTETLRKQEPGLNIVIYIWDQNGIAFRDTIKLPNQKL